MPDYAQPNFQSYAVRLTDSAPLSRNDLMQRLLDAGISTRRGIMLTHREAPYIDHRPGAHLPKSQSASDRSLLLPLFPQMKDEEIDRVVTALTREATVAAKA